MVKIVRANNRVVFDLNEDGSDASYIMNKTTGEKMQLRIDNETFVFDVQFSNGADVSIGLDSGAGCKVFPDGKLPQVPLKALKVQPNLVAANGTPIAAYGQKIVRFRGMDFRGQA